MSLLLLSLIVVVVAGAGYLAYRKLSAKAAPVVAAVEAGVAQVEQAANTVSKSL